MADDKNKKGDNEVDIFIANSLYPEAESIFTIRPKPLEEIGDECFVVLDTNALLVPYGIGKESLEQIRKTYKALVAQKRLVVPGQVAREFAKNRANKIAELFQQLSRKANSLPKLQRGKYPLLDSLSDYQQVVRLEDEIDKSLKEYADTVNRVLDHIRGWTWNDPVSLLYSELFGMGVVFDPPVDRENAKADLLRRQLHKIPPGYKDAEKEDSGIGDLLIWYTILEIGKTRGKSVIFVSGDEKADWYHRSEGKPLYPRYELIDEFRRTSNGQAFHIAQFSRFLELYGASENIVAEVQNKERLVIEPAALTITIKLPSTGDADRDTRRLRRIHGLLVSYPGNDRFRFLVIDFDGRQYTLEFPHDTTGWCRPLRRQLQELLGPNAVEVLSPDGKTILSNSEGITDSVDEIPF